MIRIREGVDGRQNTWIHKSWTALCPSIDAGQDTRLWSWRRDELWGERADDGTYCASQGHQEQVHKETKGHGLCAPLLSRGTCGTWIALSLVPFPLALQNHRGTVPQYMYFLNREGSQQVLTCIHSTPNAAAHAVLFTESFPLPQLTGGAVVPVRDNRTTRNRQPNGCIARARGCIRMGRLQRT